MEGKDGLVGTLLVAAKIKGGEADVADGKFFGCCRSPGGQYDRRGQLVTARKGGFSTNLGARLVEGEQLGHSELRSVTVKPLLYIGLLEFPVPRPRLS